MRTWQSYPLHLLFWALFVGLTMGCQAQSSEQQPPLTRPPVHQQDPSHATPPPPPSPTPARSPASQPRKPRPAVLTYPLIELYSEVDLGRQNAGSDKWPDGKGGINYGGSRDYQPHIQRTTYFVPKAKKAALLTTSLHCLVYFYSRKAKPNITLGDYFAALADPQRTQLEALLPENLDALYAHKDEEDFEYNNTLVISDHGFASPSGLTVVWLDADHWYVDDVYYSLGQLSDFEADPHEEILMKGKLDAFLRFSPLVQQKLTEGYPHLRRLTEPPLPAPDAVVLGISYQTHGRSNNPGYNVQVTADGSVLEGRHHTRTSRKIDPTTLTELRLQAQKVNFDFGRNTPSPPLVHDGNDLTITAWTEKGLMHITNSPKDATYGLDDFIVQLREKLAPTGPPYTP